MTLNAKKNKPRVNYNSTGEKIPEEKSEENSYQGNTRKNIFNVYPHESHIFFRKARTRNSKFLAASGDFCVWTGIYDWYVMIFMSLFYSSKQSLWCVALSPKKNWLSPKKICMLCCTISKNLSHTGTKVNIIIPGDWMTSERRFSYWFIICGENHKQDFKANWKNSYPPDVSK